MEASSARAILDDLVAMIGVSIQSSISNTRQSDWQADQLAAELASYYKDEWILNIADLVVTDQTVDNDGVKLLKIRFYPVATTEYASPVN